MMPANAVYKRAIKMKKLPSYIAYVTLNQTDILTHSSSGRLGLLDRKMWVRIKATVGQILCHSCKIHYISVFSEHLKILAKNGLMLQTSLPYTYVFILIFNQRCFYVPAYNCGCFATGVNNPSQKRILFEQDEKPTTCKIFCFIC